MVGMPASGGALGTGETTSLRRIRGSFFIAYSTIIGMNPYRTPLQAMLIKELNVSHMAASSSRCSKPWLRNQRRKTGSVVRQFDR